MSDVITNNLDLWSSAILKKSTAGRGSNGKQEAYGIKKLRELILGTALRGLFDVENSPLPKTIDKDIEESKQKYFRALKRKPKEYMYGPPLLHEFTLPVGWTWKRVGDLCDLQTGATPSRQKPEYFGGDIRWLVSGDINQGIINDCDGRITEEGLASSNCKILPPKTVLIALNGQGKTRASVALLDVPATCNQSLVGMIPYDIRILDPMFLSLSLRYRYYEIRDITGQNQRRGLNMGLVSELSIPLPPLNEQHRIVAKVDELMTLCDKLEQQQTDSIDAHQTLVETLLSTLTNIETAEELSQAWTRIADHFDTLFTTEHSIDQLKQTILQLAVMGKLAPQDPNDEPANVLLEKIEKEKERLVDEREIKKVKTLPEISDNEESCELPENWAWARFGFLVNFKSELVRPEEFLELDQVAPDSIEKGTGKLLFRRTVNESGVRGPNNRFYPGQILYSKIRPSLSKAIIAPFEGLCSADMYPLESMVDAEYLLKAILSEPFLEQVRVAENRIKMPKLNIDSLSLMVVPVPPLAEQHRIVAKVDELMVLCDNLKARISDAQTTQIHLADAIVEQAVA